MSNNDLIAALRARISDDRASISPFTFSVVDPKVKRATLEIVQGFFDVSVEGADVAKDARLSLSIHRYSTVGRLVSELSRLPGFKVTTSEKGFHADHPSIDLSVTGIVDVKGTNGGAVYHHLFSDGELVSVLKDAISLHNPSYDLNSVPSTETVFVLLKAHAEVYRRLASDTVRRKSLDADAQTLIALAQDLDRQYAENRKQLNRVIPSPKANESEIGHGDIVVGSLVRRSLKTGRIAPGNYNRPPTPLVLLDCDESDIEDDNVKLHWRVNRDGDVNYYELWRDTQPDVERSVQGRLATAPNSPVLARHQSHTRPTTSKQVMAFNRVRGLTHDGPLFFYFSDVHDCQAASFTDGLRTTDKPTWSGAAVLGEPIEPETNYYYRLYGFDINGAMATSNVIEVLTKQSRARFKLGASYALATDAVSPQTGPLAGGTEVTIKGNNFQSGTYVLINGKRCAEVSRTLTQLVVTSPVFVNTANIGKKVDVVIISPNGLKDIALSAWTYEA